ncbi:MAG: M24 family metallopeptidase, partial [Bacteroidales bacterium]|nr:M24 family metallopeptidase [Bacteroidales bacterium]
MNFSTNHAILYKKNGKYPNVFTKPDGDILKALTGLESSAGAVVVSSHKSAVFVDGRYALAVRRYVDPSKFDILNLHNDEIIRWIKENLPKNSDIACDYECHTHREVNFFTDQLKDYRIVSIDLKKSLNMAIKKFDPRIYYLNKSQNNRLSHIMEAINQNNLDGYLLCDPCSTAWLLNIRDLNQKYTPVVFGHLLVTKDGGNFLYMDNQYTSVGKFKSESNLLQDISSYSRIGIDKFQTPFCIKHHNFIDIKNPCISPKAIKTHAEIDDIKLAAQKDSTAIINFLHWFHNNSRKITELDAADRLLYFRKQQHEFIGESFETISAADENAAIIHYHPDLKSNKIIDNILLLDSGGQYKCGTTDIARTISIIEPSKEQKLFYTLVLKGHIALASAVFPTGTSGSQLDLLARQFLWKYAEDYNHSTGHGIGYMAHVHEGPMAIARNNDVPLRSGMLLSNEPGYYQEGRFGIRLENMMAVEEHSDYL